MDFIEGLPVSDHYTSILVVVDKFSKYSHFIKLRHPFSALQVAKLYMEHVYKLHGMPIAIVSDRHKVFTNTLWKELFKLSGTQLCMSTTYHPQSDGQTERVNQCIEAYLRCFVHPVNGHSGSIWLNFGTTLVTIPQPIILLLKFFMVMLHATLVSTLNKIVLLLNLMIGLHNAKLSLPCFNNSSSGLNNE